jgi:hypothetical protein
MAWSSAGVSAADLALMANDKPILCARNALSWNGSNIKWTTTGNQASADQAATGYPTSALVDSFLHVPTKPNANVATWYLNAQLVLAFDFDMIVLAGHNLNTVTGAVDAQISDDSTFATGTTTLKSWAAPSGTKRLVGLSLFHTGATALRYSSVLYFRLRLTGLIGVPQIGELMLGRRRQLKHKPATPWNFEDYRSRVAPFVSTSGARSNYTQFRGQRVMSPRLVISEDAYKTDLRSLVSESSYLTKPLYWIENPTSDPQNAPLMFADPSWSFPLEGFSEQPLELDLEEQGGQFYSVET